LRRRFKVQAFKGCNSILEEALQAFKGCNSMLEGVLNTTLHLEEL